MKLRHRFAFTVALTSLGMVVAARIVTTESFTALQQYELDEGLRARAKEEGNEVALQGRKALELEYAEKEETDPLEQLVTYGALYGADGVVVADTPSFAHAPGLAELGSPARGKCFDFLFRGKRLRGVLVEVRSDLPGAPRYLLFAASRGDMDADVRKLLAVGWWVVLASLPVAILLASLVGRRMTRGVETLAAAARRVTAGELDMAIGPDASRDEEVAALGAALREMVGRLKGLIEIERRFASHAAHELRSPLAALRGELELALRRERTGAEYEATLRDALEDTNRLVDLAEDLLVVARLQSEVVDDRDEDVPVRELVDEAVASSVGRSPTNVEVQLDHDAAIAKVQGARVALVRMVRNMVDNAILHGAAAPDRPVVVRAHRVKDAERAWVCVDVEDQGSGVAVEDRDRVFEPFHRGAHARQERGAGLGLGISRDIARRHGGDVVMDSPSEPTRFRARLPAV